MKNTNILKLISNLKHIVSANNSTINNGEIFIQTVLYNITSKENYAERRVRLCNKQKTRM